MNSKQVTSGRKRKVVQKPLFESYVFANMEEDEIRKIKMLDGVINLVYWKQNPAIIHKEEIEVIKAFTSHHEDIILQKTRVNMNDVAKVIDESTYSMDGNVLMVKNTTLKVNLPSLGFSLVAKAETETPLQSELSFGKKDLLLQ